MNHGDQLPHPGERAHEIAVGTIAHLGEPLDILAACLFALAPLFRNCLFFIYVKVRSPWTAAGRMRRPHAGGLGLRQQAVHLTDARRLHNPGATELAYALPLAR